MPNAAELEKRIAIASGKIKAELVLKNARVVNVFSEDIEVFDIAISGGFIVGIGKYDGIEEIDLTDKYVCPGFLDGHIHLESSMVSPFEFEKAVMPHGTTGVITDPHEIANVAGEDGIRYMLETTKNLDLDVYFMLPSCVPATPLDESGAVLSEERLKPFYHEKRVLGLAELMNAYGTVNGDLEIIDKILGAMNNHLNIDGHAPSLSGNSLNAYITAGVKSDHECSTAKEAIEKLRLGQWIMVRDGTAAKNLEALIPLCKEPYYHRCMFVTDDKHPGDLISDGHIDGIIKKAVKLGVDPIAAIKMGSYHTAKYFGIDGVGAVAPGFRADLVVLSDLEDFNVLKVFKKGLLVAENGVKLNNAKPLNKDHGDSIHYPRVFHSFNMDPLKIEDIEIKGEGDKIRVIDLVQRELLTKMRLEDFSRIEGYSKGVNINKDIIKIAVIERHHRSGHIGLGFLGGYGLKEGAIATSVAHDSHNLIVCGVNDEDMVIAANCVRDNEGGLAIVSNGVILGELPLPIGGLMTNEAANEVEKKLKELKAIATSLGISEGIDPFMTLSFVSLPVIPSIRINTLGLIDVESQKILSVTI